MSAAVHNVIKRLGDVLQWCEDLKNGEMAKVAHIKQRANNEFKACFEEYNDLQNRVINYNALDSLLAAARHPQLHVRVIQAAYYTEHYDIAKDTLDFYFQRNQQKDQFYCDAKIIKALIINYDARAMNGTESIHHLKESVSHLMEALDITTASTNKEKYKFMVFNLSTTFYKIVHPFLRTGRAKFFAPEMIKVVNALEATDDGEKDWRILLLSAAAVCMEDDKQAKQAVDYVDKAILVTESQFKSSSDKETVFLEELTKTSEEATRVLDAVREVEEREEQLRKPRKIDPDEELSMSLELDRTYDPAAQLPPLSELATEGMDTLKSMLEESQRLKAKADVSHRENSSTKLKQQETLTRLYMQRVYVNASDAKKFLTTPAVARDLRSSTMATLQCMLGGTINEKEMDASFDGILKQYEKAGTESSGRAAVARAETLLDVCRVAWKFKKRNIALKCYAMVQEAGANIVSPLLRAKMDMCECIRGLEDLADLSLNEAAKQRLSKKQSEGFVASKKIEIIKQLERSLGICLAQVGDQLLAQEICLLIWNASIPLLQPHLRLTVYSALKMVSTTLETVGSPLTSLRQQCHFEVAKCEEATDFVGIAKEEGEKALHCDYGTIDSQPYVQQPPSWSKVPLIAPPELDRGRPYDLNIKPFVDILVLREGVYEAPADVEGKISMLLQQVKETKAKDKIYAILSSAMLLFLPVLDPEYVPVTKTSISWKTGLPNDPVEVVSEVPLEKIKAALAHKAEANTNFTKLLYNRSLLLNEIASTAIYLNAPDIVQQCAMLLLDARWDANDRLLYGLIKHQINAYYLLAESLVQRITILTEAEDKNKVLGSPKLENPPAIPPGSLGVIAPTATRAMSEMKALVLVSLQHGMQLALKINNTFLLQNGAVYLWNMHLHIFRGAMYSVAMPEVFSTMESAITALETMKTAPDPMPAAEKIVGGQGTADERLKLALFEAQAEYLESKGDLPAAIAMATKGCTISTALEYNRKRLVELVARLTVLQAQGVGGGGKGGKGGGAVSEIPQYDNIFLMVFGGITQAEQPESDALTREQQIALTNKIVVKMDTDVVTYLSALGMSNLTQERYSQLIELQAEVWSRLARLRVLFGETIEAQACADKCILLISKENLSKYDESNLNPRVWRWISVCKRLLGVTIAEIIQPEGQDEDLQNQLRLAAMVHFANATDFAIIASNEQLVLEAASSAWNVSMNMADAPALRERLYNLQRQIVNNLVKCKEVPHMDQILLLRQMFCLAMIEGFANVFDWGGCLKMVMEAFQMIPPSHQKPLWKWRVISMSKRGKSVLDGLAKLKESNPSLQAQVYGFLARASSDRKQQLESYMKAAEILNEDLERVDYMLECSQFMATAGCPKSDISSMLLCSLDALYEVEASALPPEAPAEIEYYPEDPDPAEDGSGLGASLAADNNYAMSEADESRVSKGMRRVGSSASSVLTRVSGGKGGTTKKEKKETPEEPPREIAPLNFKQLEQATRVLAMLGILQSHTDRRMQRCVELMYFLKRAIGLWFSKLTELHIKSTYEEMTDEAKETTPFNDDFKASVAIPASMTMFEDASIDILYWQADDAFNRATALAKEAPKYKDKVPTKETLPLIALSHYYMMKAAAMLHSEGFSKYALWVLGWDRMLLLSSSPAPPGADAALVEVYLTTCSILRELQLTDEQLALPDTLRSQKDPKQVVAEGEVSPVFTASEFIVDFMEQCNSKDSKTPLLKEQINAPGTSGPFELFTWTPSYTTGYTIDTYQCLLNVCPMLLDYGQMPVSYSLALTLEKEFKLLQDERSSLACGCLLNRISLMQGQYRVAITSLLELDELLHKAGDAAALSLHTSLLMKAMVQLNRVEDAKLLAANALQRIEETASFPIDRKALANRTQTTGKVSGGTATGAQGSMTRQDTAKSIATSAGNSSGGKGRGKAVMENSAENLNALVILLLEYTNLLIVDGAKATADGGDPHSLYMDICENFNRAFDLASDVASAISSQCADIYDKRAKDAANFLLTMHETSACFGSKVEASEYHTWLQDNILLCCECMEKAVRIRKEVDSNIPADQRVYSSSKLEAKALESAEYVSAVPYTQLLLPSVKAHGLSMLELSKLQLLLGVASSLQESTTLNKSLPVGLDPAQHYLEVTTAAPQDVDIDFFKLSLFQKIANQSEETQRILRGTDFAQEARLVSYIGSVFESCRGGSYDAQWRVKEAMPVEDAAAIAEETLETYKVRIESAEEKRTLLDKTARELIEQRCRSEAVSYACLALIESYGAVSSANTGAWVMQLQSIHAAQYLKKVWLDSLNPSNPAFASYQRLENLILAKPSTSAEMKQVAAEHAYLTSVSTPYRRLQTTEDPRQIFNTIQQGTVLCCLQFCPMREVLYVACGYRDPSKASTSIADPQSDSNWFIRKIKFSEASRRQLQALKSKHKQWTVDMTKFVATFGELSTAHFDVSNVPDNAKNSQNMLNAEKGLGARFQATLEEMETLLGGLLGEGSDFRGFIGLAIKAISSSSAKLSLCLLLDTALQLLPVEALTCFVPLEGRISRDFSIHMLSHRIQCLALEGQPQTRAEAPLMMPPAAPVVVQSSSLTYVADPFKEDAGATVESYKRLSILETLGMRLGDAADKSQSVKGNDSESMAVVFEDGKNWQKLLQGPGLVANEDWLKKLDFSSMPKDVQNSKNFTALFAYVFGRFGTLLSVSELAVMNLQKLALMVCVDQGHNDTSYRRQVSGDTLKTYKDIEMEGALELAAISSLAGLGCMVAHLWSTPVVAQNRMVETFWQKFTQKRTSVVNCVAATQKCRDTEVLGEGEDSKAIKAYMRYSRTIFGVSNIEYI